ncbi:MAG TPA: RuBisCO large subunit C-terminal-like domain-containing protein, partial [Herpetosiphonaceae bacterium]
ALSADRYEAVISYAVETAGGELTQLLNVIFGNISIKPGIRVEHLDLPSGLLDIFKGPRFGRQGIRDLLGVPDRPLLCTALKPQGLSARQLADLAYQFALGGIDIIKDDHGLANQSFAPYRERVQACAEAVERANRETGLSCIYMANVTAPADQVVTRARLAKDAGSRGLLIAPGLVGLDTMRLLADDDDLALPIMSHPAFQGSFVTGEEQGIAQRVLFGQLARLAGADATIYPNYGGRFSFSREVCQQIVEASAAPMGSLKPIFPTPGGGMSLERIPDMLDLYGQDVIFLVGGGLLKHSSDIVANCRYFLKLVGR